MKKTAFLVSWKLCVTLLVFGLCVSVNLCAAEGPTLKDLIEDTSAAETAEGSLKEESSAPATVAPDSPQPVIPADDMKRGTPRSTLLEFQKVAEKGDYERAAEYLDLRYLPYGMTPEQGPELARQLKIVLDRALWVDPELLSTKPEGHSNDGLNSFLDSFGTVEIRDRKVKLLLQRVPRDDGVLIWKISTVTVHQIPELHQEYGYGRIGEYLSKMLPKGQFLSLQLWQWIMALGILAVAYCVVYIPTRIIATLVRRRKTELSVNIARFVAGPLRFLITFLIGLANVELIHPTMKARAIMKGYTAITIIGVWACIILVGILRDVCVIKMKQKGSETAAILLRPITRVVQILVVVIGMMIWFENLGFKAATLLAGLGIGGLAVALAAQKSISQIVRKFGFIPKLRCPAKLPRTRFGIFSLKYERCCIHTPL
ncbi:MAG: hypothetical protein B6I25_08145 [Planctomycetales bacterium 4572_13]|nr:MAG: hypothetical protein B6I25_08145 [Planctomycetales bacterium 4572_13]